MRPGAEQRQISSSLPSTLPPALPFFLLPPFANASTTPIQPTTSTASCCCCLCGLSDSIRWAAGHGGGRQRFFYLAKKCRSFCFPPSPETAMMHHLLSVCAIIFLSLSPFAKLSGTAIFQSMTHAAPPRYRSPPAFHL